MYYKGSPCGCDEALGGRRPFHVGIGPILTVGMDLDGDVVSINAATLANKQVEKVLKS